MDLTIEEGKEEQCFERIAETLFGHYAIETHDSIYRITEIEFYWNSKNHVDNSTYKRIHVDPKNGEWFFHYSGVDISLRNEFGYGGILIRAIYDLNNKPKPRSYKGPMVSAMRLFSGSNAFNGSIKTKLIPYSFEKINYTKSAKIGLGKNALEGQANKRLYRFCITIGKDHP